MKNQKNDTLIKSLKRIGADLKVYSEGEDLYSVLYQAATSLKVIDFKSLNQFKRTVFTRVTFKSKELAPTFITDENSNQPGVLKSFQNLLYNPNLPMPKYYEHYTLEAVSDMISRQILILNDFSQKKPYFKIGKCTKYSPIVLFQTENKYFVLGSEEAFLDYDATVTNYNYQASGDQVVKGFFKYLKKAKYEDDNTNNTNNRRVTVLGYFSRTLNKTDFGKSIWEKESISLYRSLIYFKTETLMTRTFILTDNSASYHLYNVRGNQKNNRVLMLHLQILSEFAHVSILSIDGKRNISDFLTRVGIEEKFPEEKNILPVYLTSPEDGTETVKYFKSFSEYFAFLDNKINEQGEGMHVKINLLKQSLSKAVFDKFICDENFKRQTGEMLSMEGFKMPENAVLNTSNGFLYNEHALRFIPESLEMVYIALYHVNRSHRTARGLYTLIANDFAILDKKRFMGKISDFVNSCVSCHTIKPNRAKLQRGIIFLDVVRPCQYLSIDFFEENRLGRGNFGAMHRLLILDHFSGKIWVYFLDKLSDDGTIRCLLNLFSQYSVPSAVLCDRASYFVNEKMRQFFKLYGVKLIQSSPRHSQSRGNIERQVQRVREIVKMLGSSSRTNDHILLTTLAVKILNSTRATNISMSADELFFGLTSNVQSTNSPFLAQDVVSTEHEYFLDEIPEKVRRMIRRSINLRVRQVIEKRRLDKKRKLDKENRYRTKLHFEVGKDFVVVKEWEVIPGIKEKTGYSRTPYLIVHQSDYQVIAKNVLTNAVVRRHKSHVKKLNMKSIGRLELPKQLLDILDIFELKDLQPVARELHEDPVAGPLTRGRKRREDAKIEEISSEDDNYNVEFLLPYEET